MEYIPHTAVCQGPSRWAFLVRKPEGGNDTSGLLAWGPDRKIVIIINYCVHEGGRKGDVT